jgi:hypothetical protein
MSTTQAFAQYLDLRSLAGGSRYRFQNYWINEDAALNGASYGFMPFAFSGTTITKSGDNQPATLAFPNNALSRGWAETVVTEQWIAQCNTVIVNPDNKSELIVLSTYVAQIVNASWNETILELQMASVLDAVGADVPRKKLTKQLVGNLPITSRVRIQ